ncbi:MAG: sugar phosphate isomerase/epimerase family protein [Planctomycetota bacterium]
MEHPLAAPYKAGAEALARLGLKTEVPTAPDIAGLQEIAPLAVTAHAPFSHEGVRLNIASPQEERRQRSREAIKAYMAQIAAFPNVKTIVCHAAPKIWYNKDDGQLQQTGDYILLVEGLRELAETASRHGFALAMENNRAYYHDEFPNCPGAAGGASDNFYLGTAPEEWRIIARDVDRDNFGLCLDTSHACTFAHLFPEKIRLDVLMRYIEEPDLIRHVHWSDNLLYDDAGRKDAHLCVGEGSIPLTFHRAVKELNATVLLEHYYDVQRLERELDFIARL